MCLQKGFLDYLGKNSECSIFTKARLFYFVVSFIIHVVWLTPFRIEWQHVPYHIISAIKRVRPRIYNTTTTNLERQLMLSVLNCKFVFYTVKLFFFFHHQHSVHINKFFSFYMSLHNFLNLLHLCHTILKKKHQQSFWSENKTP